MVNLLTDQQSTCEAGITGLIAYADVSSATLVQDVTGAHSTSHSAKAQVTSSTSTTLQIYTSHYTIVPNYEYTFTVAVKCNYNYPLMVEISFYDTNGVWISSDWTNTTASTTWEDYDVSGTAPYNAVTSSVDILVWQAQGQTPTAYLLPDTTIWWDEASVSTLGTDIHVPQEHLIRVEIRERTGEHLTFLPDAYTIKTVGKINEIGTLTFDHDATDSRLWNTCANHKRPYLSDIHEAWLYGRDGQIVDCYRLRVVENERSGERAVSHVSGQSVIAYLMDYTFPADYTVDLRNVSDIVGDMISNVAEIGVWEVDEALDFPMSITIARGETYWAGLGSVRDITGGYIWVEIDEEDPTNRIFHLSQYLGKDTGQQFRFRKQELEMAKRTDGTGTQTLVYIYGSGTGAAELTLDDAFVTDDAVYRTTSNVMTTHQILNDTTSDWYLMTQGTMTTDNTTGALGSSNSTKVVTSEAAYDITTISTSSTGYHPIVVPGEPYTFSFYMKASQATASTDIKVTYTWEEQDFTDIWSYELDAVGVTVQALSSNWQRYSVYLGRAPLDAYQVEMYIEVYDCASGDTIWLDATMLENSDKLNDFVYPTTGYGQLILADPYSAYYGYTYDGDALPLDPINTSSTHIAIAYGTTDLDTSVGCTPMDGGGTQGSGYWAQTFTPTTTARIGSVELPIARYSPSSGDLISQLLSLANVGGTPTAKVCLYNTTAVNLLTANQSNVETDLTGLSGGANPSGTTFIQDTTTGACGSTKSAKLTNTSGGAQTCYIWTTTDTGHLYWQSVSASTLYQFSVFTKSSGGTAMTMYFVWYDSSYNWISSSTAATKTITSLWAEYTAQATSPSNAAHSAVQIGVTGCANGTSLWWDQAYMGLPPVPSTMIEQVDVSIENLPLSPIYNWYTVTFDQKTLLTAGTPYAIVLKNTPTTWTAQRDMTAWQFSTNGTGFYEGGQPFYSDDNGARWTRWDYSGYEAYLKVHQIADKEAGAYTTTNLFTANLSSAETNVTDFTVYSEKGVGSYAITQDYSTHVGTTVYPGNYNSAKLQNTYAGTQSYLEYSLVSFQPVSSSTYYTFSAYVKTDWDAPISIQMGYYDSSHNWLGGFTKIVYGQNWTRGWVTALSPATAAYATCFISVNSVPHNKSIWYDWGMFEARSAPSQWILGGVTDSVRWVQGKNERTIKVPIDCFTAALQYVVRYRHAPYMIDYYNLDDYGTIMGDKTFDKVDAVDALPPIGNVYMMETAGPAISYKVNVADLFDNNVKLSFEKLELGNTIRLIDEGIQVGGQNALTQWGRGDIVSITSVEKTWDERATITLNIDNNYPQFTDPITGLARHNQVSTRYKQRQAITSTFRMDQNCDPSVPLYLYFKIHDDAKDVGAVTLTWERVSTLTDTSTTSTSGGSNSGSSTATIANQSLGANSATASITNAVLSALGATASIPNQVLSALGNVASIPNQALSALGAVASIPNQSLGANANTASIGNQALSPADHYVSATNVSGENSHTHSLFQSVSNGYDGSGHPLAYVRGGGSCMVPSGGGFCSIAGLSYYMMQDVSSNKIGYINIDPGQWSWWFGWTYHPGDNPAPVSSGGSTHYHSLPDTSHSQADHSHGGSTGSQTHSINDHAHTGSTGSQTHSINDHSHGGSTGTQTHAIDDHTHGGSTGSHAHSVADHSHGGATGGHGHAVADHSHSGATGSHGHTTPDHSHPLTFGMGHGTSSDVIVVEVDGATVASNNVGGVYDVRKYMTLDVTGMPVRGMWHYAKFTPSGAACRIMGNMAVQEIFNGSYNA